MRKIFITELIKAAKKNKKIILIVNDLGYGVVDNFAKKFPKQFINAGVAEQNMMGLAAGLAMDGNHVFVYSIGNFSTFRCAEQIRNDIDYHKLAVTIINVGPGVDYGHLGYSHHSIQDYSLMRTMPNILISSPSNNKETKIVTKYLLKSRNPNYLRLSKHDEVLTNDLNYNVNLLKPGKWIKLKNGKSKKKAILLTGNTLFVLKHFFSKKKYKDYSIFSLPLWGMKYKKYQLSQAKKFNEIITLENHLFDGGFGSWFNEAVLPNTNRVKISNCFLKTNVIGQVGSEKFLIKKYFKTI